MSPFSDEFYYMRRNRTGKPAPPPAPPPTGPTYYIALGGNDANNGSIGSPWANLEVALTKQQIYDAIGAGNGVNIIMRNGVYDQFVYVDWMFGRTTQIAQGTSWSNAIKITHLPGEVVTIRPTTSYNNHSGITIRGDFGYYDFDGINLDGSLIPQNGGLIIHFGYGDNSNPAGPFPLSHHIRYQNSDIRAWDRSVRSDAHWTAWGGHVSPPGGAIGGFEILNNRFFEFTAYGIYLATNNSFVLGNEIFNCSASAVHAYNGSGGDGSNNNIIAYNRIHHVNETQTYFDPNDNRMFIILVAGDNNKTYNNLIYDCGYNGTQVAPTPPVDPNVQSCLVTYYGTGNRWWNNTVVGNTNCHMGSAGANQVDTQMRNNVSRANFAEDIIYDGGAPLVIQSNNNFGGANPLFTNEAARDLTVQEGSPLINAGTPIANFSDDFTRVTTRPQRGAWDIGAYEKV